MITVNIDKAKAIGHEIRREKRAEEFKPLDEALAKRIPGVYFENIDESRQIIREKYAAIQTQIDKDIAPPKEGLNYQRAQLTSVQRNKAKLGFNCDHCGIPFEKYACWAKRTSHHYCGRACASAAKVVRIPKPCVVCGTEMLLTPTLFNRVSGCSKECMRKRRIVNNSNLRASPDYLAIVKRLKENAVCGTCSTTNGPWVVQGIKTWVEDGLACADGSSAHLVCRHCHLDSVAHLSKQSTYMSDRFKYYKEKNHG